ncbi:MAG: sensor histidine kinase, partial [Ktedonobacteraceae bacterium]
MHTKDTKQAHQGHSHRKQQRQTSPQTGQRRTWWRAPLVGYAFSILLVIGAFLITRIGTVAHIHDYFVGVPFVIGTFLAGWIWGIGPALVTLVMSVLSLDYWIIPPIYIFTFYKLPDLIAFIPFISLQLIVLYLIWVQKKYRQQLRAAQQEASKQAEELAKSNQALAQSNTQLEQADRVKDQFLSMASHELRTPVTSIHGYVQLLMRRVKKQSSAIPELLPVYNSLATVDQQAKRLTNLMNELLDINSLRAGKIPLRRAACDLSGLCQQVIAELTTTSERPIDLQIPPDPIILQVDAERISQVMNNLVTNAIKYSPEQTV